MDRMNLGVALILAFLAGAIFQPCMTRALTQRVAITHVDGDLHD